MFFLQAKARSIAQPGGIVAGLAISIHTGSSEMPESKSYQKLADMIRTEFPDISSRTTRILISDFVLCISPRKSVPGDFGLLQHYLPISDARNTARTFHLTAALRQAADFALRPNCGEAISEN